MLMMRITFIFVALLTPITATANDSNYKYCSFAGYFGVNTFMGDLAVQIASQRGLIGDTTCQAAWRQGYEVGEKARRGQAKAQLEIQLMLEASAFSTKVNNFIIQGAGL